MVIFERTRLLVMEQYKRRSKMCEEELDRKIALIREKNIKIEQRSKEIEADRVNSTDETSNKSLEIRQFSKNDSKSPKILPSTGEWTREWDYGKTPAETWRENVPSIENVDRLLRRGGATENRSRGIKSRNGGPSEYNTGQKCRTSPQALRGMHDRMLPRTSDNRRFNRGKKKGEQGSQSKGRESVKLKNKPPGNIGNSEEADSPGRRHRLIERQTSKENNGNKGKDNATVREHLHEAPKRNRRGDKYIIGTMLRKLVDRVVRMEKQEKKFQQRQQTNNRNSLETENTNIHPGKDVGKMSSIPKSGAENLNGIQTVEISDAKSKEDTEILTELPGLLLKEENGEEESMNGNEHSVIKLVEEKVLTMHLSPI